MPGVGLAAELADPFEGAVDVLDHDVGKRFPGLAREVAR